MPSGSISLHNWLVIVKVIAARLPCNHVRAARTALRSPIRRSGTAHRSRAAHRGLKIARFAPPSPFSKPSRPIHRQTTP